MKANSTSTPGSESPVIAPAGSKVIVTIDVGSFHPFTVKMQKGRRIAILDAIVDALGLKPGDTVTGAIFGKVEASEVGGERRRKEEE